jgi:hypothetical protein
MFSPPIIIIDSISDCSESRLCKLKLKPSIAENPNSGGFSAELKGVEYLPGKKMDIIALYGLSMKRFLSASPVEDERSSE